MFGYNIEMDNQRKIILRDYFDFTNIRTVKREMGIEDTNEVWDTLWETYKALTAKPKRKKKSKVKIATAKQRKRIKKKRDKKIKEKALATIVKNFRNYVARRRARRVEQQAIEGNVRTRTYTPQFTIPFIADNINKLSSLVMTNFFDPLSPQHIIIRFRFFVIFEDNIIMYQNRKIFEANYTRANRLEFIARLKNAINEELDRGFGNTKGYDAYVINIRITSTARPDLVGGCAGLNCKEGKFIKFGGVNTWKTFNPKGNENTHNCLFKCLEVKGNLIRKELGIEKNIPIKIDLLPTISDHLKIGIKVYDAQKREILNYGHKYDKQVELILSHQHYLLVVEKSKKCLECGKVWYKQHLCNHKRRKYWAYMNGEKVVMRPTTKLRTEPIDYDNNVVYYDFETFTPINQFEVYAAGYYDATTGRPENFYGKESLTDFIKHINTLENKTFIAHNGARFDCYFVVREMLKQGIEVKDFIMNNGAIMTFKFGKKNKFLDSCCFISSKLGDAGKSFKIPEQYWKSEFNHNKIRSWADVELYKEEVIDYLDLDIYCLKYVWEAFSDTIYNKFNIHTIDFITTSSMTYTLWQLVNESTINMPSEDELNFIHKSTYGANVYPVKKHFKSKEYDDIVAGKVKYKDMTDYLMIMDVVSLYPTSMLNKYPVGKARWTEEYEEDLMGIWEISFTPPKDILFSQLPRKVKGGIIHSLEKGRGVYNSIDIARAVDAGYTIDKVHKGLVWDTVENVFASYIEDVFSLKCKAKEEDDDVMYAISKLLLNGLYGKTLQKPIFHKCSIISDHLDALDFINTHETITDVNILNENFVLYSGELTPENKDDAITKPTQLGSFVLGYSRTIMYDIIKAIDPTLKQPCFYYTDTDCLHIHGRDMPKVKHLLGDELGQMNSDLKKEGRIIEGIYLSPKQYTVSYIGNDNKVVGKYKCKGIANKYLNEKMYQKAISSNGFVMVGSDLKNDNKSTEVEMTDRFKKIHYKQNSNQQEFSQFSIHLEDVSRTFYKNEWNGRTWLGNNSFPLGHQYPTTKLLTDTGLPLEVAKLIISKM